jgi:hypothetical protein
MAMSRDRRLVLSILSLLMGYFALFTAWWVSYRGHSELFP